MFLKNMRTGGYAYRVLERQQTRGRRAVWLPGRGELSGRGVLSTCEVSSALESLAS